MNNKLCFAEYWFYTFYSDLGLFSFLFILTIDNSAIHINKLMLVVFVLNVL